jgi:hypothetical protein
LLSLKTWFKSPQENNCQESNFFLALSRIFGFSSGSRISYFE